MLTLEAARLSGVTFTVVVSVIVHTDVIPHQHCVLQVFMRKIDISGLVNLYFSPL